MPLFDDAFASSAALDLLAEFGETITYTPRGGSPRTITAIVNRNPARLLASMQDVVSALVTIRVLDDASNATYGGIASSAVNLGGDSVTLAVRAGETPSVLALNEFLSDDGGVNTFGAN